MPGQPYVAKLPDGRFFVVELPEGSAQADPVTGEIILHAPAIHLLDRLRTLLSPLPPKVTSKRLEILRQALGLSGQELAGHLGMNESDITAWENGTTKPDSEKLALLEGLRLQAVRRGVILPPLGKAS